MAKRLFFRDWLVLALLLVPTLITAQEVTEAVDSIEVDPYEGMIIETYYTDSGELANDTIYLDDKVSEWQKNLPQYGFDECERVDTCMGNPKYAIVMKDGKKGIFDVEWKRNITEVVFDDIGFAKQTMAEDGAFISLFYAKKGIKCGIVSLYEPTNNVVSVWMDDSDEVYSLGECTTIDKKMTKKATTLLGNLMKQKQMDNLQLVVLDAKSGHLKTWIRLDQDKEKDEAGKLLVHSCAGSLTKPFHAVMALENDSLSLDSICAAKTYRHAIKSVDDDMMHQVIQNGYRRSVADRKWRELTDTGNPSTSPFILAVGYNSLANGGTMIIPTMKGDSVNVEENVFSDANLANLRDLHCGRAHLHDGSERHFLDVDALRRDVLGEIAVTHVKAVIDCNLDGFFGQERDLPMPVSRMRIPLDAEICRKPDDARFHRSFAHSLLRRRVHGHHDPGIPFDRRWSLVGNHERVVDSQVLGQRSSRLVGFDFLAIVRVWGKIGVHPSHLSRRRRDGSHPVRPVQGRLTRVPLHYG